MSSREAHCKRTIEELGAPFDIVHKWLDELTDAGDGYMDTNHRRHRHNKEGVAYVKEKWGDDAAKAATAHILDDMGIIHTKEEMLDMYGTEPDLHKWEDVFGGM